MTDPSVGVDVSGGQIQGIVGAGSVVIENLTFYARASEEPAKAAGAEPIGPSPYPGLAYFGPADTKLFFGRDAAIARLASAVGRQSFTALVGASGSGKSSVVLAGLAPRLQSDSAGNWRFSHFRIGTELEANPFLALARALAPIYVTSETDAERIKNTKVLAADLASGETTLRDVFADARSRNKGRRILLIADQFEEVFTTIADEAVQTRFIDALLAGFSDPPGGGVPDICLILTMRADFYGRALRHRPLADALQNHVENLGPMNREELHAAIVQPAQSAGVSFEAGVVETLLDTVQSKPGGLPLLQFALREMWGRQEHKKITRKSYDEIGGVEGALAQRAETVFAGLTRNNADPVMDKAFQRLFTRLVTLGDGQEDTRRVVERTELGDDVWTLAQRLAGEENRLVVTNASTARETAEVVHEALIRHWPRLVDWINRDRAFQSWLRQIAPGIELWSANPDDEGPLLRGGMLAQASDWLARRRDDLSDKERGYIEASVALRQRLEAEKEAARQSEIVRQQELAEAAQKLAEEQRRRARTARAYTAVAAVIALIAIGSAIFAASESWRADSERNAANAERDRAKQATARAEEQHRLAIARQLATEARFVFNQGDQSADDLHRSLALATASLRFTWTQEGFEAWADAMKLLAYPPSIVRDPEEGPYAYVTLSPDGRVMAAAGKNSIFLMDGSSLERIATLPQAGARTLTFSPPDGRLLAAGVGNKVMVWNVAERRRISEFPKDTEHFEIRSIAFDPQAKRLAIAGMDHYARVFETADWTEIARTGFHATLATAFSPDGRWLLTSGPQMLAWDLTAEKSVPAGPGASKDPVPMVHLALDGQSSSLFAFSRDGSSLVTRSGLWSVAPAEAGAEFRLTGKVSFGSIVAISADASVVATSGVTVWQVPQTEPRTGPRPIARMPLEITAGQLSSVAFGPDGKWLVAAGDRLERWEVATGAEFAQLPHETEPVAVTGSPDGRYVVTTSADGFAHIWNTNDWSKVRALEILRPESNVTSNVAFSGDNRWLAATSQNVLKIFSTNDWSKVASSEHKHTIESVTFSPDARWVITLGSDNAFDHISVIETGSWRTTAVAEISGVLDLKAVSISPDGRWLATRIDPHCGKRASNINPGLVRVWDMTNGERVASMPLVGTESLPQEQRDRCSGRDPTDSTEPTFGKLELARDSVNWKVIPIARSDGQTIQSLDGRWSATSSQSSGNSIELRHDGGRPVILPHLGAVNAKEFLQNGRWLVTTNSDGKARVWALNRDDLIAMACPRLRINLSEGDWRKYLGDEPYMQVCPGLPTPTK